VRLLTPAPGGLLTIFFPGPNNQFVYIRQLLQHS
jgi:hypothetical protein